LKLDRVPPSLTPQEFVNRWRGTQLRERSASQSHFNDLCRVLGWPSPTDVDQEGEWYTFERGVAKLTGAGGWADVWLKDHFGWEHKGPKKDLDTAYAQLLKYKDSLGHPPLLVVSDMDVIEVHPQFLKRENKPVRFELDDLLDSRKRDLLDRIFWQPDAFKSERTTEEVTAEAAGLFAQLAERLHLGYGGSMNASQLSAGSHTLSLTATDSNGLGAMTAVSVSVQ
jgi:hypothetical protein